MFNEKRERSRSPRRSPSVHSSGRHASSSDETKADFTALDMSGTRLGTVALPLTETVRALRNRLDIPRTRGTVLLDGSAVLGDSTPLRDIIHRKSLTVVKPSMPCRCYMGVAEGSIAGKVSVPGALHIFGLPGKPEVAKDRPHGTHGCFKSCTSGGAAGQLLRSVAGLLVKVQDTVTFYETRQTTWVTLRDFNQPQTAPALLASKIDVVWQRVPLPHSEHARRREDTLQRHRDSYTILSYRFKVRVRSDKGEVASISFSIDGSHEIVDVHGDLESVAPILFENFVDIRPVVILVRVSSFEPLGCDPDQTFFRTMPPLVLRMGDTRELAPYPAYVTIVTEPLPSGEVISDHSSVEDAWGDLLPGVFRLDHVGQVETNQDLSHRL